MQPEFSVVAIVSAFNEADIIGQVVRGLIDEGLGVFLLDDGSTDGTTEAVAQFLGRGLIGIERLAPLGDPSTGGTFDWGRILARKAQLAGELEAAWFVHHDADEFRESPWAHVSMKEAIRKVDALGYNAIDFECLDFWPVTDQFRPGDDVRAAFQFYAPAPPYNQIQIRCWKRTATPVDLLSSGGHEALFADRRVFPVRFILRHYPIRGQAHGARKVFQERNPRFLHDERARGWHVQYDALSPNASFIREPGSLKRYDGEEVRVSLMLRHRGVEDLENAVVETSAAVERLRETLNATALDLDSSRRALQTDRQHLQATQEQLQVSQQQLEESRQSLAQTRSWIAELEGYVQQLEGELNRVGAAAHERARRLDDVLKSRSWRWTAAPRKAYALLQGAVGGTSDPS